MMQLESSKGALLVLRTITCLLTVRTSKGMMYGLASTSLLEGEIFFIAQSLGLILTSVSQSKGVAETPAFRMIAGHQKREGRS